MNSLRRRIQTAMQGGGKKAFLPPPVAGVQFWYDATQIVGLNDGDAVATWNDLSVNGRNLTQGTAASQPTYQTNEQNGKPGVLGDGVDDSMSTTAFTRNQPHAVWICYRANVNPNHNTLIDGHVVNTARLLWIPGLAHLTGYAGAVLTNSRDYGNTVVAYVLFNGASGQLIVNGVSVTGNIGSSAASGLKILAAGATFASAIIFEMFGSNGSSTADRDVGIAYLTGKWL